MRSMRGMHGRWGCGRSWSRGLRRVSCRYRGLFMMIRAERGGCWILVTVSQSWTYEWYLNHLQLSLTTCLTGELTAHDAYLCRPEEEVPENEPWRTARPVPATAYFDGLHDDLMALRMVPLPGSPSHSEWDIWPTEGIWPDRQRWVDVSNILLYRLGSCY
jgi:hypothetical protein